MKTVRDKIRKDILFIFLVLILLSGLKCSEKPAKMAGSEQPVSPASVENKKGDVSFNKIEGGNPADLLAGAVNQFAFNLYQELGKKPENVFFSPVSLSTVMAMVYEGARGRTAEEIRQVFSFPEDIQVLRSGQQEILAVLNRPAEDYELRMANALWAQKNFSFLPTYFETVEKYYGGRVTGLDFVSETEKSRQLINRWVEEQTRERIKDLIPQGVLNSLTRLVLTNAIYFKGRWEKPFPKEKTAEQDFRVSKEKVVRVPFMQLKEVSFNYLENDILQAVELPYAGEKISTVILLPRGELGDLNTFLNRESWQELKRNLRPRTMDVYLPRFKFETKYLLGGESGVLARMGMPSAFSEVKANLSGMTGKPDLYVTEVVHQAVVEVNEEGTEAAAATGAVVGLKAVMERPVFRADHPFIFLIQERQTGAILFLGRVVNPAE